MRYCGTGSRWEAGGSVANPARRPGAGPAVPRLPSAYREGRGHGQHGEPAAGEAAAEGAAPPPLSAAAAAADDDEKPPAWAASFGKQLLAPLGEQLDSFGKELASIKGQLASLNRQSEKTLQVATNTFEATVRSRYPSLTGPTLVHDVQQLALLLDLPTQDLEPVYEALAEVEVLHLLRARLVGLTKKSQPQKSKAQQHKAAVADWCAASGQPRTAAEWQEEEALAGKVIEGFVVNSPPHRAFRMWRALCAAAAQDAASPGSRGAVLSLLYAEPPPLMWRPDMTLAAALAGACQPLIELDLPVEVHRTAAASTVTIGEVKTASNAMGQAKVQLERAVRVIAWLHDVLGLPQPEYVGCVVVPSALQAEASRWLGRSLEKEVEVPQGRGKVKVTWQLRIA